jgi:hypothetical protein
MKRANGMLKPAVVGTRIYEACKAQLLDVTQALEPWMLDDVVNKISGYIYESVNRIIDNLPLVNRISHELNLCNKNRNYF